MNANADFRPAGLYAPYLARALRSCLFGTPASATTIERVVSPGGIEAWLVHEPAVPLIAVDFAFAGGTPGSGRQGRHRQPCRFSARRRRRRSRFQAFHARLERKAIELAFRRIATRLRGTLRTLTENRDEAFDASAPRADRSRVSIRPTSN